MCKYMKISIVHSSLMANKRKHTKHDRRERLWRERERERGVPLVRASRTPLASRYFLNASFFDSLAILLVLPMKPVSSFHTGQEIGARGEGCDETTTQTTRASHPHHLFGISINFQRLLLYFPGLLQRSWRKGDCNAACAKRRSSECTVCFGETTPFALRRFQCGMVVANSTCGIC
jgi:hypothetical protein